MRRQKYGAIRTTVNGITFASRAEARRYQALLLLERAGEIRDLELQPAYPFVIKGILVGTYRADFRYRVPGQPVPVVEDVKGVRTPVYRLKAKLMQAIYGITIQEVA